MFSWQWTSRRPRGIESLDVAYFRAEGLAFDDLAFRISFHSIERALLPLGPCIERVGSVASYLGSNGSSACRMAR